MTIFSAIGAAAGMASFVAMLYVVFRVGFRVDELWTLKEKIAYRDQVDRLETRVHDLEEFAYRRAQAEARIKHAIRDR